MNSMTETRPDFTAVKTRQQATWAAGDYAVIGSTLQIVGETLCAAMDLPAGASALDVAAGNGNAALAAARHGLVVTATDYVPALLERARMRAAADGLMLETQVADAEALPFADASFDGVMSTFGVMFTPDQDRAAAEMMRVCRPGGKIGMANWSPEGFVGQLFKTIGAHLPPPAGVRPPSLWGTEARLREMFAGAADIAITQKDFVFRYRSAAHWIDVFRSYYGPVNKAFGALDAAGQAALTADMMALLARFNTAGETCLRAPSAYLEVVITR
jgi:SAM-dependent methyltransferase